MGKTASLFHFDEPEGINPHDAAGGLDDLIVPAGLSAPPVVPGLFGLARQFPSGYGLCGKESTSLRLLDGLGHGRGRIASNQLRLRRDVTIEAIVGTPAVMATVGRHTITARGLRGSIAERRLYSLAIDTTSPSTLSGTLVMGWDEGTAPAYVPGAQFRLSSAGWMYFAATRRWVAPNLVVVTYYANGKELGSFTVSAGNIVDGDGGSNTYGCEGAGAGVFTNFFLGELDDVRVSNVVRTGEEIELSQLRMFELQPQAYEVMKTFTSMMGDAYSKNPDSVIQRELMVEGDALGYAWSLFAELERYYLPDRATRMLDDWERICRIQPGPADSFETRRNRILGFMRKIAGYSRDQIVTALAPVLDCQPSDIEIIENENTGINPDVVFIWFAHRDPALGGNPDFATAQRMLDEMRPAHTLGVVGESTEFRCDDPHSLCDRDLLGE